MLRLKRILVPTDFSPASDEALTSACQWGRSFGAEIHLLHVLYSLRPDVYFAASSSTDASAPPATLRESAAAELEVRRRMASGQGVVVKSSAVEGLSAAATILEHAAANEVDLIALSTHGRRGVRRMLLGSVAEEVVQLSDRPVLTIGGRERSAHALRPRRIVVPVDLSEHSRTAVRYAKHLATVFEARLRLLHVVTPVPQTIYYDGAGLPQFVFPPSMMDDEVRSAMERFYASADGPSAAVELDVEHGAAVEGILRSASMHEADLLLMASHGLTGLSHLMMGSVAERVVRRAGCPVFTVKSFGRSLIIDGESPAAIAGVSR